LKYRSVINSSRSSALLWGATHSATICFFYVSFLLINSSDGSLIVLSQKFLISILFDRMLITLSDCIIFIRFILYLGNKTKTFPKLAKSKFCTRISSIIATIILDERDQSKLRSHNRWRIQGGGKWAIAHFIWRFAHL